MLSESSFTDAGEEEEATLELTLISVDGFKDSFLLLTRSRTFAVAWVDPQLKKSIKSLSPYPLSRSTNSVSTPTSAAKLHFPLPISILRNPSSVLTIQLLAPRLPFRSPKLLGAACFLLSSARITGDPFVLPLFRPSGRQSGTVRFAVRLMWCLDPVSPTTAATESMGLPFFGLSPSAPPLQEEVCVMGGSEDVSAAALDEKSVGTCWNPPRVEDGREAWRSFWIGLASGAVATVLVGFASLARTL